MSWLDSISTWHGRRQEVRFHQVAAVAYRMSLGLAMGDRAWSTRAIRWCRLRGGCWFAMTVMFGGQLHRDAFGEVGWDDSVGIAQRSK